ncbi:hypothetical protein [Maritimibacter sp. 55A14]|uniref:hypothetical protein n=1 Tax=Maritimibacter sp. 55A14 TaxID=2174844 RepID=UPI0011B20023|nr:hypothetical protein [Maritimibacter sp. 55A14]
MINKFCLFVMTLAAGSFLGGCAYENRALQVEQSALTSEDGTIELKRQERQVSTSVRSNEKLLTESTVRTAIYALRLSDAYKGLGDEAARNRDLSVVALITIAGAAALGNASSIEASDLAAVLATGAVVNEGVKYVNPGGAAEAFYSASESMACASAKVAKFYGGAPDEKDFYASSVALWYIRRIELLLRADLQREVPNFSSLLQRLGIKNRKGEVSALTSRGKISKTEQMQAELDTCIREAGGSDQTPDSDQTPKLPNSQGNSTDLSDVVVTDG